MTYLVWVLPIITAICFLLAFYGQSIEIKKLKSTISSIDTNKKDSHIIIDREKKVVFLIYKSGVDMEAVKYLSKKMYEDTGYHMAVIGDIDKVELI